MTDARTLANAFADRLFDAIGADNFAAMKARNASLPAGICASHDFCDANEVMAEAFLAVMGRDSLPDDDSGMTDADCALWNEAWAIAKRDRMTESACPFPFPAGNQGDWTAAQWQAAANRYWYDIMGVDRSEPNYRPVLSLLESAFKHASSKARALRAAAA